jgi:aminoglycoside phosphotransferase (APT) family kinase protein
LRLCNRPQFLHDITTKNVIVDGARLSGIVDVDDLCFGDPLLQVGLTRMALLASDHSATYADAWIDLLGPRREQVAALDFYTALFCIDFMAELGRRFNRAEPQPVEKTYVERLRTLLDRYLA